MVLIARRSSVVDSRTGAPGLMGPPSVGGVSPRDARIVKEAARAAPRRVRPETIEVRIFDPDLAFVTNVLLTSRSRRRSVRRSRAPWPRPGACRPRTGRGDGSGPGA